MGFIKIDRKIIHWEYFKNPAYLTIWLYLLCRANFKDGESYGHVVHRGQVFETYGTIAKNTGLSRSTVRRTLKGMSATHLATYQAIHSETHQATYDGILITIVNYNTYQTSGKIKDTPTDTPSDIPAGCDPELESEKSITEEVFHKKKKKEKDSHPSDEKPKAKYKDWNEDWKYTDSRGNKYDWGYMVRNFGDNAENMARIIVDEDRKSRS